MGQGKWTSEMNSKFIALYRQQEVLWRTDSVVYRDKDARDAALGKIIAGMGLPDLTLDDVKKKIKYLRSTYMVEVNKIKKSLHSGTGVVHKPCLSWFHEMDSFIKYVQVRSRNNHNSSSSSQQNPQILETDTHTSMDDSQVGPGSADTNGLLEHRHMNPYMNLPSRLNESGLEQSNESDLDQPLPPKRLRLRPVNFVEKNMKSIPYELTRKEDTKEYEVFGNYVGIQLQSLLEEDAIVAVEEIQSIITRYKLKKIRRKRESCYITNVNSQSWLSGHRSTGSHYSDSQDVQFNDDFNNSNASHFSNYQNHQSQSGRRSAGSNYSDMPDVKYNIEIEHDVVGDNESPNVNHTSSKES